MGNRYILYTEKTFTLKCIEYVLPDYDQLTSGGGVKRSE